MGSYRVTQCLIMQCEGDLDRAEGNDQAAHEHALKRQVVENPGNVREVCEEKRQADDQCADDDNDAGPLQNITEAAHGEAKEFAFFETHALYPSQTHSNQINLDVDAKEVFENECGYQRWPKFAAGRRPTTDRSTPVIARIQSA